MEKRAVLVTFEPRTRVVVDIPKGMSITEWLNDDNENWAILAKKARENMLANIEDYLSAENLIWKEDKECPYGTLDGEN